MEATTPLFTCLSCEIAFPTAVMQRDHYRSDHHRYNMKRRVAALPPVSAETFNQKILERRSQTTEGTQVNGTTCQVCNKSYASENAYRSHFNSNKHKENELKAKTAKPQPSKAVTTDPAPPQAPVLDTHGESEEMQTDDPEKSPASPTSLAPEQCLFCPRKSGNLDENLSHMSSTHSFFIPDTDYLVDLPGLIQYLAEKVAVKNVCLFCNLNSREFRTLDAVRKHMVDKSHCKVAYDTEIDRLELSDHYDFTSSYPVIASKKSGRAGGPPSAEDSEGDEEWEDMSTDGEDSGQGDDVDDAEKTPGSDTTGENDGVTYGDSEFELVLPSGARVGHRSLRRYYAQSFRRLPERREEDPESGAAVVRRLLQDKNSALIPSKGGGFGTHGRGSAVIRARNVGEAQEAGKHIRQFRDQRRREEFKTQVGYRNNHQKHFRDPLLQ